MYHRISSFRDPDGTLFAVEDRILRKVCGPAMPGVREFLASPVARELTSSGRLVGTREIADAEALNGLGVRNLQIISSFGSDGSLLEHDRVWFPSYAYEWPPEMLYQAGRLTLDIAETALAEGFCLKDATPYNVLYRGPKPLFVDLLSFEKRHPLDATWLPGGQFVRTFLLPLLMHKEFHMGLDQLLITRPDGVEPEEAYAHCTWRQRLGRTFLTEVSIPTWLKRKHDPDDQAIYQKKLLSDPEKAAFILRMQLRRLRKVLERAAPRERDSAWTPYMSTLSYSGEDFERKDAFVRQALQETRPQTVLDVGCNTGHFSALAARQGARVVAIDVDPVVVGRTWRSAAAEQLDIVPLVVNLARPTPATGWRNAEYPSFLERAAGSFDLVMALAVVHHLLVTERIPLVEIVNLLSELTSQYAVIEYVAKEDPMFQRLTRGREALHANFTQEAFEAACRQQFSIRRAEMVKGGLRCLYLLEKTEILSEIARGISLANLCFAGLWVQIIFLGDSAIAYFRKSKPDFGLPLALLADILLLGGLIFLFLRFQRSPSPARRWAGLILFVAVSAFALNEVRVLVQAELSQPYARFLWTALFPALAAASILAPRRVLRAWWAVLLAASPLFPILVINAAWLYGRPGGFSINRGARAPKQVPARANRAIWIIFDELDERLAFDARPRRVLMPEFDRLRRESLFAAEALPPASDTLFSLPSLITGRKIADVKPTPTDLRLRFAGVHDWTRWSSQPNVFQRAREAGFNTALSGWYHPYCRVIGEDLCDCARAAFVAGIPGLLVEDFLKTKNFFGKAAYLANWRQLVSMVRPLERAHHIEEQQFIYENATRMLRDRDLNLLLIHLPIPHDSGIWDAGKQAYTTNDSDYLDNLLLADRVLGEMRQIMERNGDWERSVVLVSSDHPYRPDTWRKSPLWTSEMASVIGTQRSPYIPFLLKLPGQREGLVYDRKFNTILSGDLLLNVLNGRLRSSSEVSAWLDSRADQSLIEPEGPLQPLP